MKITKLKIILIILFILLVFIVGNIIWSNNVLTYNYYTVETSKINNDITFVAISDSEGKTFGENNQRLIEKIKEAKPEFVVILGDMVNETTKNTDSILSLCNGLSDYPVYYTLGNHEDNSYTKKNNKVYSSYKEEIEKTGAHLLINEMENFTTSKGDKITIAGLRTFPFFEYDAPDYDNDENNLLQSFLNQQNENHFSILMCHYPEVSFWGLKDYNIDLMVSGHTHGGVVQLPFVGGLYAPEQGWFPDYYKGYYKIGKMEMIITAGLGKTDYVPRFNNPPDVTVVTLKASH
jgi:hypothetical protein